MLRCHRSRNINSPAAAPVQILLIVATLLALPLPAAPDGLGLVEWHTDGVAGLDSLADASHTLVSPDGQFVYVASGYSTFGAVTIFERDAATGKLTLIGKVQDGLNATGLLDAFFTAFPPGPNPPHLYVTTDLANGIVKFDRDIATGLLSNEQVITEGDTSPSGTVEGMDETIICAVSPDGLHVYVSGFQSGSIAIFSRNTTTGNLTWLDAVFDSDLSGIGGLDGAIDIKFSPDGQFVYASGALDAAIVLFSRNAASGLLTHIATYANGQTQGPHTISGLAFAGAMAFSPDPEASSLYVAGQDDNAVVRFSRNETTGELTFEEAIVNGVGDVRGMAAPLQANVAPNGQHLYVACQDGDTIAVFNRNTVSGALNYQMTMYNGIRGTNGIDGVLGLCASPDSNFLYAAGSRQDSVAVFRVQPIQPMPTYALSSSIDLLDANFYDGKDHEGNVVVPSGRFTFLATASPDLSQIAFAGLSKDLTQQAIYRVDTNNPSSWVDLTGPFQLNGGVNEMPDAPPTWSPNGAYIYYRGKQIDAVNGGYLDYPTYPFDVSMSHLPTENWILSPGNVGPPSIVGNQIIAGQADLNGNLASGIRYVTNFPGTIRVGFPRIAPNANAITFHHFNPVGVPGATPDEGDIYLLYNTLNILSDGVESDNTTSESPTSATDKYMIAIRTNEDAVDNCAFVPVLSPSRTLVLYQEDWDNAFTTTDWWGTMDDSDFDIMVSRADGLGPDRRIALPGVQIVGDVLPGGLRLLYSSNPDPATDPQDYHLLIASVEIVTPITGTPTGDNNVITTEPQIVEDGGGTSIDIPGNTTVDFPTGANQEITVTTPIDAADQGELPPDVGGIPLVRDFGPDGASFSPPIPVIISYADEELGNLDEPSLRVFTFNTGTGKYDIEVTTITERDTDNNTITFTIDHFSKYGVGGSPDTDGDGQPDNLDNDDDNDGVADGTDPFPLDTDDDGIDNIDDPDDDSDGRIDDVNDPLPFDTDNDGIDNATDNDDDADGFIDNVDDPSPFDTDNDGDRNDVDPDDDNDGVNDDIEDTFGTDPLNPADFLSVPLGIFGLLLALLATATATSRLLINRKRIDLVHQ